MPDSGDAERSFDSNAGTAATDGYVDDNLYNVSTATDGSSIRGLYDGSDSQTRYEFEHSNPSGTSLSIPGQDGSLVPFYQDPQTLSDTQQVIPTDVRNIPGVPDSVVNAPTGVSVLEALGRADLDMDTQGYWAEQDARDKAIAQDAATLHGQVSARDPAMLDNTDQVLAGADTKIGGASALLGQHDGIVIAGDHSKNTAWDFLTNHMQELYRAGVRTIYTESLRDDGHQDMVDQYLRSGPMDPMDPRLDTFLNRNPAGLRTTIEAARNTRMHVQGFGGWSARRPATANSAEDMHVRAAMVNTYGSQVVQQRQATNPGKYVMEIGAAHGTTHDGPPDGATVQGVTIPPYFPGVGDILNVPVVQTDPANPERFSQLRDHTDKPLPDPPIDVNKPPPGGPGAPPGGPGAPRDTKAQGTQTDVNKSLPDPPIGQPVQDQFGQPVQDQFGQPVQDQFGQPVQDQFGQEANQLESQPLEASPWPGGAGGLGTGEVEVGEGEGEV